MTLRQGDYPSWTWFGYGIDPLLIYLQNRLSGILIHSLPVIGLNNKKEPRRLQSLGQCYTVIGYCDDLKPAISNLEEFYMIDEAVRNFENASGCQLHRDITTLKCKILLLGNWNNGSKDNIPLPYLDKSEFLDILGVKLFAKFSTTRSENGKILIKKVSNTIDKWKSGKFLPLTDRPKSTNTYALSKEWYRAAAIDLKIADIEKIESKIKTWTYQYNFLKPEQEMV